MVNVFCANKIGKFWYILMQNSNKMFKQVSIFKLCNQILFFHSFLTKLWFQNVFFWIRPFKSIDHSLNIWFFCMKVSFLNSLIDLLSKRTFICSIWFWFKSENQKIKIALSIAKFHSILPWKPSTMIVLLRLAIIAPSDNLK